MPVDDLLAVLRRSLDIAVGRPEELCKNHPWPEFDLSLSFTRATAEILSDWPDAGVSRWFDDVSSPAVEHDSGEADDRHMTIHWLEILAGIEASMNGIDPFEMIVEAPSGDDEDARRLERAWSDLQTTVEATCDAYRSEQR